MSNFESEPTSQKVVIHYGDKIVNGYLESSAWTATDYLTGAAEGVSFDTFRVRLLGSDDVKEIPAAEIRAVFYVKSFEFDPEQAAVTFASNAPIVDGVWMHFQFIDGEVMEGIVLNSLRYLVDPGFFVIPTAPETDIELIYVPKNRLIDHRVLGLRSTRILAQSYPESATLARRKA